MILLDPRAPFVFGVVMIGLLGVYLVAFHAMPGSLAEPHAEAIRGAGLGTCDRCHSEAGLTKGCLACHTEIADQLTTELGYHAFLAAAGDRECAQCHPDHVGRDFPLASALSWRERDPNEFDHPHVLFTLAGAHDGLACEACHQERLSGSFTLPGFPSQGRPSTYLGLTQECVDCHADVHAGGLAKDCLSCHNQEVWRPAPLFKHDDYYVLEGAHERAECFDCHLIPDKDDPNVSPEAMSEDIKVAFDRVQGTTCIECHADPHRTKWVEDCTVCHLGADESWAEGVRGMDLAKHALVGFPLDVPHADVACEECHPSDLAYAERYPDPNGSGYARQVDTCAGCHADPHAGQFASKYPRCLDCHEKDHFVPAQFDVTRHADVYSLSGPHETVDCNSCHQLDADTGVRQYVATAQQCAACHDDPHAGQFDDRYATCLDCHEQDHFRPTRFDIQRHADVYPLKGGHQAVPCVLCHVAKEPEGTRQFVATPHQCKACHEDPHGTQFQPELSTNDCTICHSDGAETFQIRPYDHQDRTGYPFTGAHAKAACADCHRPQWVGDPNEVATLVRTYRGIPTACAACHEDVHRGQFQQEDGVHCDRCHGSTFEWIADRFEHNRDSRYVLEGVHLDVTCQACHPSVRQPDGQRVTQYRPLGTRCEDCHGFVPK